MKKLLLVAIFTAPLLLVAQKYTGSKTVNAAKNMTISILVDTDINEVELTLTGPENVWFAYGFGSNRMTNTYTIVTTGAGTIGERKLGNHNAGSSLASSFTQSNFSSSAGIATTTIKRAIIGQGADYFSFPENGGSITLIWGYGSGSNLAYHAGRGATTITLTKDCTPTTANITLSACGEIISPSGKYTYTQSGMYKDTIPNAANCDSIITIEATVNPTYFESKEVTACKTYTTIGGTEVSSSGVYYDTLLTQAGCDSIFEAIVTIAPSKDTLIAVEACEQYVSPSGQFSWTSSGTYKDTLETAFGCDSIITIDLLINTSTSITVQDTSCGNYLSPAGKTYTASGTYKDTIPNIAGCDSIITIELEVYNTTNTIARFGDSLVVNSALNSTYQWIDCDNNSAEIQNETDSTFKPSESGKYACIVRFGTCVDTTDCIDFIFTSISQNQRTAFSIYPNPSNNSITLKTEQANFTWTISSFFGQKLMRGTSSSNTHKIDLTSLPVGTYLVTIQNGNSTATKKLQIVR